MVGEGRCRSAMVGNSAAGADVGKWYAFGSPIIMDVASRGKSNPVVSSCRGESNNSLSRSVNPASLLGVNGNVNSKEGGSLSPSIASVVGMNQ